MRGCGSSSREDVFNDVRPVCKMCGTPPGSALRQGWCCEELCHGQLKPRRKPWGFLRASMLMKTWLTVLGLRLAVSMYFMVLLNDLLVFRSMYDYSSPHFGWGELILHPVSYCCASPVNATSAACLLHTPALAYFHPVWDIRPLKSCLDFSREYSEKSSHPRPQ